VRFPRFSATTGFRFAMLCALAVMALLAAGCQAPPDGRVHLTWASGRDDGGFDHEVCRRFMALHPEIEVSMLELPRQTDTMHNQYATYLIAEDDSIDIYSIDVIWPPEFGSAGWAVPLDDWFTPEERAKFLKGPLAACTYKGHIYAIPWYSDAGVLFYRKDLLDEAGLAPPKTWQEMVSIAKRLQNEKRNGLVFQAAQYEGLVCDFLEYVWGNGGDVLDADGRVVLDSPENIAALQFLSDVINKEHITPPGILTYHEDESAQAFQSGGAVFLRSWPYIWGNTQKPGEPLLGKVGIAPFPHNDRPGVQSAACLGGWNIMISRYSRHPKEAWMFTQFLTSYEIQRDRLIQANQLPTREAAYLDPAVLARHPQAKDFLEVFRLARPRPVTPYYSKLSDILQIQVHRALSLECSPGEALKTAADQIRAIPGIGGKT
jgi:multiple sugar transport system substrate-binding protein